MEKTMKELNVMHIKEEETLSRSEMKNILAGSNGCGCTYCHDEMYCNGCQIIFTQQNNGSDCNWIYQLTCSDGTNWNTDTYYGSGSYTGTFCNGQTPCS